MEIRSIQQNYPNPNFRGIVKLNGDPAFLKEFAERFKSSTFFESGKQCGRPNDIINVNIGYERLRDDGLKGYTRTIKVVANLFGSKENNVNIEKKVDYNAHDPGRVYIKTYDYVNRILDYLWKESGELKKDKARKLAVEPLAKFSIKNPNDINLKQKKFFEDCSTADALNYIKKLIKMTEQKIKENRNGGIDNAIELAHFELRSVRSCDENTAAQIKNYLRENCKNDLDLALLAGYSENYGSLNMLHFMADLANKAEQEIANGINADKAIENALMKLRAEKKYDIDEIHIPIAMEHLKKVWAYDIGKIYNTQFLEKLEKIWKSEIVG